MPRSSKRVGRVPKLDGGPAPRASKPPAEGAPLVPVVGMGASAGGLEALRTFFTHMPPDSGMAFVVVQHLDPRHVTLMPELLGKTTRMSVEEIKDETPTEPNHVYVIPPNASLTIEGGVLRVKSPPEPDGRRMSIDRLFHSLAEDQGHRAICLLFSGTGSDGTLGLRAVKEHGGLAMAQSPESAKHDSILRSAIATGMVDYVLPPEEMPSRLVAYAAHLRELHHPPLGAEQDPQGQLTRICALLRRKTGHDFSRYKAATLTRRVQRRMQVLQVPSMPAYVDRLRLDAQEANELFRDLLIGVTRFFRDPEVFETIARNVLPRLFDQAGKDGRLRIWIPGCATGEEAYSLAILAREELERRGTGAQVQIFASDIDDEALDYARQARYPEGIAEHVSPERLAAFFVPANGSYEVARHVREMCIFSLHNLIRDPPFSRLDLVACRNLLIYLETDLQQYVANLFHYSLRRGGYLVIGPSESVAAPPDLFQVVDKKHRVFQKSDTVSVPAIALPFPDRPALRPGRPWAPRTPAPGQPEVVATLERVLLDHYAPAWVVVNAQGESIYFSPRTGRFLEPAAGNPTMDILGMARKGLRLDLRTAIHKAVTTGAAVTHAGIEVEANGQFQPINLVVRPLTELGQAPGLFLVVFQEVGPPKAGAPPGETAAPGDQLVQQLESELRLTKDHLQATVEEVEASNAELKTSNEELLSTNEELQSANEELQTSKEELQSVNEELETINAELTTKVTELDSVNSDLQNLLQSTQIPTLFVDDQLRIRRFTEAATPVFRLIASDVGRPITDLAPRFEVDLIPDLRQVQRTREARELQVRLSDGSRVYLLRILPYRRVDGAVDGLVLTLLDVTELQQALEQHARLASIVESSQDAIVGRSFEGTILTWNAGAERMFGFSEAEAVGQGVDLFQAPESAEQIDRVDARLRRGEAVPPYESSRRSRDGRLLHVSVALALMKDAGGGLLGASMILRDITELKRAQDSLRKEIRERDRFLALLSHELRNPLAPLRTSLEVLRLQPSAEQGQRSMQVMDRQLSHLTSLVDQLMDAARIASGKIVLDRRELDLVALLRAVLEDHGRAFTDAGLQLDVDLPVQPLYVVADRLRVSQAVGNLLGNAAKFTPPGGRVKVSARAEPDERTVAIEVSDSGVGIEAPILSQLFHPFVQAGPGPAAGRGGLGLGLALVKGLVESHGGTVQAGSAGPGRGAQFTIRLPRLAEVEGTRVDERGEGAVRPSASISRRILIVEDNPDASESLRMFLTLAGHHVEAVDDGQAALDAVRGFRPDVVLCDLSLPGELDGLAVARNLKADPAAAGPPFLVALTGFGQAADQERTRAAGFDRHLTKPANLDLLRKLLDELPGR